MSEISDRINVYLNVKIDSYSRPLLLLMCYGFVFLTQKSDVDATGSQSATVNSPNVTMKITDRSGSDIVSAQVGDPLMLRFEILETSSMYKEYKTSSID